MLSQMNHPIALHSGRLLAALALILGLGGLPLDAQAQANQEFRQWLAEQQSSFAAYRDQHDADFARWLDEQWVAFDTFVQRPPVEAPKPDAAPVWQEPESTTPVPPVDDTPAPITLEPPIVLPESAPEPAPAVPSPVAPSTGQRLMLHYEGLRAELRFNQALEGRLPTRVNDQAIADYWQVMSSWGGAEEVGRLVAELARRNNLNTYDQLLVMHSFAGQLVEREEAQTLLTWYLAVRQGLQVRVGYDARSAYLLVATRQSQYNVPYVTYQGVRFYAFSPEGRYPTGQLTSYSEQHRRASSFVELQPHPALNVGGTWEMEPITIDMYGVDDYFQLPVNPALARHFERYPQLSLQDYFAQPMPTPMRDALRTQLLPRLQSLTLVEQANYLLRFAQFATGYMTDQEQFGQENYQHPVESFTNGYNDCEDRALIFALLVRDLLQVEVMALYFPGHVATALRLPPQAGLGSTQVGNATFYWADPSYLHATVGRLIPQVEGRTPQIIGVP
ncbi:MAG: hypothetical protein JXQ97_06850 [Natronospirillum sp.]